MIFCMHRAYLPLSETAIDKFKNSFAHVTFPYKSDHFQVCSSLALLASAPFGFLQVLKLPVLITVSQRFY